jgi:hypothetical protein
MPARRKDGMYWDSAEDLLMSTYFSTGSTKIEKVRALNAVLPKLRMMARIVLERYYSKFGQADLCEDAIMHLLQYAKFDCSKSKTYYAYIGTTFKRFFYTKFVIEKEYWGQNKIDDNYDVNDNQWVMNTAAVPADFDEFDLTARQEILNKIIKKIDDGILKVDKTATGYRKRRSRVTPLHYIEICEREILILVCCKEYFLKYFLVSEVSSAALADYCRANVNVPMHLQEVILRKFFGTATVISHIDNRKSKMTTKMNEQNRSYMMDDYAPNENRYDRSRLQQRLRKGTNTEDYHYF